MALFLDLDKLDRPSMGFFSDSPMATSDRSANNGYDLFPPIPTLTDYGLSETRGFLPDTLPLPRLPDPYYNKWEDIVANLQALILCGRIRPVVDKLSVYSVAGLESDAEWRRAYSLLCFLAHAYIWGGDQPSDRLPPAISVPLQRVADHLQVPPVATYAALCLWNFKPIFDNEGIDDIENLATLNTFTGSLDESWFYLVSVAIEARGAHVIPLMLRAIHAARRGDAAAVTQCLRTFAESLEGLVALLHRIHENCDPLIFYSRIRPFLAGSKGMAGAGLPRGVVYEDMDGRGKYRQYSGGSNAQSSLIQFFDIILGVEHRPTRDTEDGQQTPSLGRQHIKGDVTPRGPSNSFIQEMRQYMPGPHAKFLVDTSAAANIKHFVRSRPQDKALCLAYDSCLAMLSTFRDKHIAIVYRYVAMPAQRSFSSTLTTDDSPPKRVNLATSTSRNGGGASAGYRGTGGTSLVPFLKQVRDETLEPVICEWTKRLLSRPRNMSIQRFPSGEGHIAAQVSGMVTTWTIEDEVGGICHW